MTTYIGAELRRQVIERAGNCCEYCRLSQADNTFSFQIDHVIAEKHEGETVLSNLWLSCPNSVDHILRLSPHPKSLSHRRGT